MKYLRTVHEHNRPYHSLAIASTKRETITFEVCAVCIRQDSTPMVLLRWNQMKKSKKYTSYILSSCYRQCHRLQIKACVFFAVVLQDSEKCVSLLVSLESDERKWHWPPAPGLNYTIHVRPNDDHEDLCDCEITSSRMCELPFCCQVPRREGHEIRTLPPNCLYQQFLAVTRTESWSRQSFSSKSGSRKDFIDVRAYHSRNIQEYLEPKPCWFGNFLGFQFLRGRRCPRSNSGHKSMELPTRHALKRLLEHWNKAKKRSRNWKTSMDQ